MWGALEGIVYNSEIKRHIAVAQLVKRDRRLGKSRGGRRRLTYSLDGNG
jgi:hypothetical protein